MGEAGAPMQYLLELWNEWEIQVVIVASFSLQVILFFFAGIRRYNTSFVVKALLWLVYLLADVIAAYALGHMSSSLSKKSNQLMPFWAPFLVLHLGGQDTITAYALEDNELWLRHLLNMFVQVAGTAYVLYKYIKAGGATFARAAMWVLAAGVFKYVERIRALKLASKKGSARGPSGWNILCNLYACVLRREYPSRPSPPAWMNGRYSITKNKKFGIYAFIVAKAHMLCLILVKPLIIDRNEASINWNCDEMALLKGHGQGYQWDDDKSKVASEEEKRQIGEVCTEIEVELGLMYDMLYTKAEVIHTCSGYCTRAISFLSCFAALVVFTKSKRDSYTTTDIVITFALLGGACAMEVASVFKAIGSTWAFAVLIDHGWYRLADAILFARSHLVVVKDGRWSNSVGQFDFISSCVRSSKFDLKEIIAILIGARDLWKKACYTKHVELSPTLKEFVWDFLKGTKSHLVEIEEVEFRSGNWARRFKGIDQSEHDLDCSLSFEFHKSMLIWYIATSTFLNNPTVEKLVNKKMAQEVNTLSQYMMYLLVQHPDILPKKPAARDLLDQTRRNFPFCRQRDGFDEGGRQVILDYKMLAEEDDVLMKACTLAHTMLVMKLGLAHKMAIIGTVWMEMLCYVATNASGGFHARQLSNGGEFLTHILLLTKYSSLIYKKPMPSIEADDISSPSSIFRILTTTTPQVVLYVDNGCNEEVTEIP
ncbi:unnamed protein product [Triticum turgidum subsp. durum]|nr:unnamed protein product [Triticum turgidum subsp. durum]